MSLVSTRTPPVYLYADGRDWVIDRGGKTEFYPNVAQAMARGVELGGTGGWTREVVEGRQVLVAIPKSEE